MKRRKFILLFYVAVLFVTAIPLNEVHAAEASRTNNPYHILYISSYSYSWGSVPLQIEGVDRAFEGTEYVVNYEFMDTKNTDYSDGYKEFYDLLKYKMDTRYPYDGIIVGDDAALNFVELYRDELFKQIPIAFFAVDNIQNGEKASEDPLVTGIVEQADYSKNIEIAHKLCPDAAKITFILDNMENGMGISRQLEKQTSSFKGFDIEYMNSSEYTHAEICQKLASFGDDDIVFFISMGQQENGIILTENERYQMIRQYASVPMFRLTPAGVGEGAVGGYVVDFEESGYIAGEMIEQMIKHPEQGCPDMRYDTPGMYFFDYEMMDKYHLKTSLLPEEAVVINQPESFWRMHSNAIIIGMLLILLAAFIIFSIGLRRAQKKVEAKNRELMIANNAKTDFLSHMSHDMRTPMNGILGITSLLHDRTDPAEIRSDVEQIEASGRYLLSLINDTLDMNKIEAGRMELHPVPVNSEDLFSNVIVTAQVLAAQKDVRLGIEIPQIEPGRWVPVIADASRVEQIFMNIISNAIKFTPQGGSVTLHMETVAVTQDCVKDYYCITDTGIGMSEEFQKHLFEPFSQEGRTNTDHESGTGLGLAIVKQIVDLMGGTIEIHSKQNEDCGSDGRNH